ncbi:MAG TPA: Amuc_1100 family pilus-like protein [Candidatus Udaeobacter sp.]|jgi:hypothetical protein|nr:Amuc_1100 family pilus-like protein [Candidatus Udaeobacter sp.]
MNWFRQNRALGTLLIAFGIGVIFAGIVLYWRWSAWTDARQAFDQAAAEKSRLQRLDPFPNDANYRKLQGYLDRYNTALDKFKDELKKEVVPALPLAPNEFQSRLRQATVATQSRAQTNHVKLPDKFQLGFDEFTMALPDTAVTPLLDQELSQIQMLINILLDAKVDSVTSFHRAPLPEEHPTSSTATPSSAAGRTAVATKAGTPVPKLMQRNVVDLTFKATPAAARKVLNEIANSTGQFFIVRALRVHSEKDKGPLRQRIAEPTPAATPAQPGAAAPLNFIVGNEHIEVSATIEMLRFGS